MAEFDLATFIQQNISTIASSTQFVAGAVVGAMFLRKKTRIETETKEFEKIKAGLIKEAAEELLNAGKISLYEFCKMDNYLEIAKRLTSIGKLIQFRHRALVGTLAFMRTVVISAMKSSRIYGQRY